jgi:hypothetical protein
VDHFYPSIPLRAAASSSGLKAVRDMSVPSRAWWQTNTPSVTTCCNGSRLPKGFVSKINAIVLQTHVKDYLATAILRDDVAHTVDELGEAFKYQNQTQ